MKLLIASDIHGDYECAKKLVEIYQSEKCDKLLLLGDILYHGPRNDLPGGYSPKAVIELLNGMKNDIISVRGNCDTEVDQVVLSFPILADYALLSLDGITVFATHGHKFNTDALPPLKPGDILLHGHTHVLAAQPFGNNNYYLNPGSVSIPRGNNPRSYMIYEEKHFTIYDFDGNKLKELAL
ncbi:MAG: phosphodiesterase [Clostridia bacterium]|nr:phosphodiesterase [Clostridia bacterium]